jgi:hypothetical protein
MVFNAASAFSDACPATLEVQDDCLRLAACRNTGHTVGEPLTADFIMTGHDLGREMVKLCNTDIS